MSEYSCDRMAGRFKLIISICSKLINVLKAHIGNAINNNKTEKEVDSGREESSECILYKTTKNLHYIIKFIIRSRTIFATMNDDRDRDSFEESIEG